MLNQSQRRSLFRPSHGKWVAVSLAAMLATACASMDMSQLAEGTSTRPEGAADLAPKAQRSQLANIKATESGTTDARLSDLARASKSNPRDPKLALRYARALKKAGRLKDALTVLETASAGTTAGNRAMLVERGLLSLELGQAGEARQLLASAGDGKSKDWRVLSGLGIALATLGQHAEAQRFFQAALDLAPNNSTVLNNLAMSYLLDKKVDQAEQMLRRAAGGGDASPRVTKSVTQNLTLTATLRSAPPMASKLASETVRAETLPPMGLTRSPASR